MRPPRDLVLLVPCDLELSRWRMVLGLHYRVHGTTQLSEAQGWLGSTLAGGDVVVATTVAGRNGADALAGPAARVLLFGVHPSHLSVHGETLAHRVEARGDRLAARVLGTLQQMFARKRGPKALNRTADMAVELAADMRKPLARVESALGLLETA